MASLIIGKQNSLTQTWSVAAGVGTLVISGNFYFDLGLTDIVRIEDTTQSVAFGITQGTTFSNTFVAGLPIYTWTFPHIPAGVVSGDTVLVYINVTPEQNEQLLLQYQKA